MAIAMRNCQNFLFTVSGLLDDCLCHLNQSFVYSSSLIKLIDCTFLGRSHDRFDLECTCHKCFYLAESAVFTKRLQIIQYKKGMLLLNIRINRLNNLFKWKPCFFALLNFHCNQSLTYWCRFRIKDVNLSVRMILLQKIFAKNSTVVRSTQLCWKSYRIYMFCLTVECTHIALRRRACRFRTFRALCNPFQKIGLIKCFIIYNIYTIYAQCQSDWFKAWILLPFIK